MTTPRGQARRSVIAWVDDGELARVQAAAAAARCSVSEYLRHCINGEWLAAGDGRPLLQLRKPGPLKGSTHKAKV